MALCCLQNGVSIVGVFGVLLGYMLHFLGLFSEVDAGLTQGAVLIFVFTGWAMAAVGRTAQEVVKEVCNYIATLIPKVLIDDLVPGSPSVQGATWYHAGERATRV